MIKNILGTVCLVLVVSCNGSSGKSEKKSDKPEGCQGKLLCLPEDSSENRGESEPEDISNDLAYFKQFLLVKEDASDDPDFPEYMFRFLMMGLPIEFNSTAGQRRNLHLSIGLYADGQFSAVYNEDRVLPNGGFFPDGCKEIAGEWEVVKGKLELRENGILILQGSRSFQDNQHGVSIVFKEKLITSIEGKVVPNLTLGYTNIGYPEDSLFKCLGFPF